jgi:hypothetical protein
MRPATIYTPEQIARGNDLARRNLGLMFALVKRWGPYAREIGVDGDELFSLAGEALVKGSRWYQPEMGSLSHAVFIAMRTLMNSALRYRQCTRRKGRTVSLDGLRERGFDVESISV